MLTNSEFYIIVPKAATNYVTNPSLEDGTTRFAQSGGATIAQSATEQRRGVYSLRVTPVDSTESGAYFGTVSATDTEEYVFSVDLKGVDGQTYYIQLKTDGDVLRATKTIVATGDWQREEVTFTATATEDWRLYVLRDDGETGTDYFYLDGWQFEGGTEATTYFDGDSEGFVRDRNDFGWNGTRHASTSYRLSRTRAGGELLRIKDYARIRADYGLGMGTFGQSMIDVVTGGAVYQTHTTKPRNFHLVLDFDGAHGEMQADRKAIIDAIRPDYEEGQPLIVRYQGFDDDGDEASEPLDIVCVAQSSLNDTPDTPYHQKAMINFTVLGGYLQGAFEEGAELDFGSDVADADYIVYRDTSGRWKVMDNAGAGVGGLVRSIIEGPDGSIYIAGDFMDAGGVPEADFIAKWDGINLSAVGNPLDGAGNIAAIYDMDIDANGNLYVVGTIVNMADNPDADFIAMWDGSGWNDLDTGGASSITNSGVLVARNGNVYVGGSFTNFAGIADADHIAMWDGSGWNSLSTGLNDIVYKMAEAPNGDIYICGEFTSADGADGDYLCYWDGSAFNRVGITELNGVVYNLAFDNAGNLIIVGNFTNAGGLSNADYIAKWNGSQWSALGTGLNNYARSICISPQDDYYVSGVFTRAGEVDLADRIAVFSGNTWRSIDIDLPGTADVYSIFISRNNHLYIGGSYSGTATSADITVTTPTGGANVYPIVEIEGPGTLVQIANFTTGKTVSFSDLTLQTGEIATLDFSPTTLNFRSTFRGKLDNYIVPGSDKANFYLKPGDNNISLLITGTDTDTAATIKWRPTYWAIDQAVRE
jgi:hypothetical protein